MISGVPGLALPSLPLGMRIPNCPIRFLTVARRLEIELTSNRADGKWTWRAAGAKQPKGILDGSLLPEGVGVGDVLRVEADATLDGLEITTILPPRAPRSRVETLPLLGSGRAQPLVTSQLAPKGRSRARGAAGGRRDADSAPPRRKRADRKEKRRSDTQRSDRSGAAQQHRRGDRDGQSRDKQPADSRRGDRRSKDRDSQRDGASGAGSERDQRSKKRNVRARQERPKPPSTPRAPRLRPGNKNRRAALADMPEIQHGLAEVVLKGGVPGVRKAIERMNKMAEADGIPKVKSEPLVALVEKMTPVLKAAEWRDRAEAAISGIETVDLRDIRSVVVASDSGARDEQSRELAEKLREGLSARVESEHRLWLNEIAQHLADGRIVRALRLSSRPPKAGSPLPFDMAERLTKAASESLSSDVAQQRWATVLDAVAFSPVRSQVTPQGCPENPNDQLLATVRKLAPKIPEIAALFGVASSTPASSTPKRRGGTKRRLTPPPPPAVPPAKPVVEESSVGPVAKEPAADAVVEESSVGPVAKEPAADAVVEESSVGPVAKEPAADAVVEESSVGPVAKEPAADAVVEESSVGPVAKEPAADAVVEESSVGPVAKEPAADAVVEESSVGPVAKEPAADAVVEESSVGPVAKEPAADAVVEESSVGPVAKEPAADAVVEESSVGPVAKEPAADAVVEEDPSPPPIPGSTTQSGGVSND